MQSYLILPRFVQHVKLSHDKIRGDSQFNAKMLMPPGY